MSEKRAKLILYITLLLTFILAITFTTVYLERTVGKSGGKHFLTWIWLGKIRNILFGICLSLDRLVRLQNNKASTNGIQLTGIDIDRLVIMVVPLFILTAISFFGHYNPTINKSADFFQIALGYFVISSLIPITGEYD